MNIMNVIETIVRDAKVDFIIAKHDGVLEAVEIVHIALKTAKKVFALANLSEDEKDALVVLCLKKGLAAAGNLSGLPAFDSLPASALRAVEDQLLKAAVGAAQAMRKAVPALFAPVLRSCLPYCSAVASVLDEKEAAIVREAVQALTPAESTQVLPSQTAEVHLVEVVKDTPLPNTVDTAPNPDPSQKAPQE